MGKKVRNIMKYLITVVKEIKVKNNNEKSWQRVRL